MIRSRPLAKKGGVLEILAGIRTSRLMDEYRKSLPPATLADGVAHIDHVVKLAGVDYAGIGSDYDGVMWHAFPARGRLEVPELDPGAAREGLLGGGYSGSIAESVG
jgi:microsomal dipeptidase-like Zn-dependent dipeptidase